MTETWLSFCVRRDGPPVKQGYTSAPSRSLAEIEGEVKHSMEGSLRAGLGELDRLDRRASWTFSLPKVGPPLQHYPMESITWHAGVLGDRSQDTSLIGNLTLVGEEHEGIAGEPLTPSQLHWTTQISKAIRRLCPRVEAARPTLRRNLWEHNWLSQTSCPSGRVPWDRVIVALQEEDDMLTREDREWLVLVRNDGLTYLGDPAFPSVAQQLKEMEERINAKIAALSVGAGPTAQQIADEIAKRLKD